MLQGAIKAQQTQEQSMEAIRDMGNARARDIKSDAARVGGKMNRDERVIASENIERNAQNAADIKKAQLGGAAGAGAAALAGADAAEQARASSAQAEHQDARERKQYSEMENYNRKGEASNLERESEKMNQARAKSRMSFMAFNAQNKAAQDVQGGASQETGTQIQNPVQEVNDQKGGGVQEDGTNTQTQPEEKAPDEVTPENTTPPPGETAPPEQQTPPPDNTAPPEQQTQHEEPPPVSPPPTAPEPAPATDPAAAALQNGTAKQLNLDARTLQMIPALKQMLDQYNGKLIPKNVAAQMNKLLTDYNKANPGRPAPNGGIDASTDRVYDPESKIINAAQNKTVQVPPPSDERIKDIVSDEDMKAIQASFARRCW